MANFVEDFATRGMGKAKAAKAALMGLKGVFRTLAEEHGEITILLRQLDEASEPAERAELFPRVRKELLSHERAEMSELYLLLLQHAETRDLAKQHERQVYEIESILEELSNLSYKSGAWGRCCHRLVEFVTDHAEEEENNDFQRAQEVLSDDVVANLDRAYTRKRESILRQIQ